MVQLFKTLCLFLNITSTVQLTVTVIVLFAFIDILIFTKIVYTIIWALVAGTITLTTTTQMRTTQEIPKMEKVYGYTACYQKITVSVSLLTHLLVVVLAVVGILGGKNYSTDFFKLMKNYSSKQSSKTFVDEVQLMFQCCGSEGVHDWFIVQWSKVDYKPIKRGEEMGEILFGQKLNRPNLAVPYSCCSKKSPTPCKHDQLDVYGTKTLYTAGCADGFKKHIEKQLYFQITMSSTCIMIEILVLGTLFRTYKSETTLLKKKWRSRSVLDETSSLTEIIPTSTYSE